MATARSQVQAVHDRSAAAPGEVRERLEQTGARLLAMTMVDNGGITRVKAVPVKRLERVAGNGVGMADIWAVAGMDDHFAAVPPYDTPSGDMRLVPDLAAARALHAAPGWAWAPVDQLTQELEPVPACQRTALKRAIAAGFRAGIQFKLTYEIEMTLLDATGRPAHDGPGYSPAALAPLERFALDLVEALEAEGIEVEQFHPEYSPGQAEVSVAPRDPLAAADQLVLSRITARQVARAHGFGVSFAPVVFPGAVGNGCHLHVSAWRDGVNLMQGGDQPGGLTADGAAVTAGVLEALPGLVAVLAPSVPGYGRLQPQHWAGAYACWGVENREAALRLIPGTVSSRARSANLEVKAVDGAANPYLAAAVILAAALDGLARRPSLPPPVQTDPGAMSKQQLAAQGISRLPADLTEATDLLERSAVALAAMGTDPHAAFVGVRRMESDTFGGWDDDRLAEAYRWRY
jgi:glutamine synthetase